MWNKWVWIAIFIGTYFFKSDVLYLVSRIFVEDKPIICYYDIPLAPGKVITQMKNDLFVINKTKASVGAAVLGEKSVIGKIVKTSYLTQVVRLTTHRESKISVILPGIARALLKGEGEGKMILIALDYFGTSDVKEKQIQKGDILRTLGIEDGFPRNQPIAEVVDVKDRRTVICKPIENFDLLTFVFVEDMRLDVQP